LMRFKDRFIRLKPIPIVIQAQFVKEF